jgi:hypothetical protein
LMEGGGARAQRRLILEEDHGSWHRLDKANRR